MALPFSFSPSSISVYRDCPRKFKLTKDKVITWAESPAKERGTQVHKYMELAIKKEKQTLYCPDGVNPFYTQDLINKYQHIRDKNSDTVFLEYPMCVDSQWKPCDWFADDVMIRSKADLLILNPEKKQALIGDFKTGKIYPGMDLQVRTYALMCYVLYGMTDITWELYYLDQGQTKSGKVNFDNDLDEVQDVLNIMNEAIQLAKTGGLFPAQRNTFCRFCSVYHDKTYCPESLEW